MVSQYCKTYLLFVIVSASYINYTLYDRYIEVKYKQSHRTHAGGSQLYNSNNMDINNNEIDNRNTTGDIMKRFNSTGISLAMGGYNYVADDAFPASIGKGDLQICKPNISCEDKHSGIPYNISLNTESFENISKEHLDITIGGTWKPSNCISRHSRLAIIIPYRDRKTHLHLFIKNIIPFLKAQNKFFTIFVVEQIGPDIFNKAQLMNAGFIESQKLGNFACFIFHDVDMIPTNLCNIYECPSDGMRHLGLSRDVKHPHYVFPECVGGGSAFTKKVFQQINGFTNVMFGWGGEDDDGYHRLKHKGIKIHRHSAVIGNYIELKHKGKDGSNPRVHRRRRSIAHHKYMKYDGLNSVDYHMVGIKREPLFTRILINISGPRFKSSLASYFEGKAREFEAMLQEDMKKIIKNPLNEQESS